MDEVFGNSSTETVVSVQELDNKEPFNENDYDKSHESSPKETISSSPSKVSEIRECAKVITDPLPELNEKERNSQPSRASVIKCINTLPKESSEQAVFKVPTLPSVNLRHTQSAIVQRPPGVCQRARAHSTTATPQANGAALKHHPYQNIPLTASSLSHIHSPSYVNLPKYKSGRSNLKGSSSNDLDTTNSAPSTPRGSRNPISPRVNTSYIQLWTGVREESKGSSEQDSLEMIPGTGYVSMSSPLLRSPDSSILSDLASQLSSYTGVNNNTKDIFCPFCPRPFTREQNLKHHIQAIHRHELQKIACGEEPVTAQYCPLCHGRFFNLELLPSHLLEFHRDNVIDILDTNDNIEFDGKEIKCAFCVKKVPASQLGEEMLLYHILQHHCSEYQNLIRDLFKPVSCFENGEIPTKVSTEDLAHALSFRPRSTSTPGLSLKFKTLSCENGSLVSINQTYFEETWNSHAGVKSEKETECINELQTQTTNKGILRSQTDLSRKPSVKRELRFSVPPVTSAEFFIPESPESSGSQDSNEDLAEHGEHRYLRSQNIPIRIDSLSSADFIEMNNLPSRKRRRLGIGLKSKKSFKKKKDANQLIDNVFDGLKNIGCTKPSAVTTSATRTFRKPKPVDPPTVPIFSRTIETRQMTAPPPPSQIQMGPHTVTTTGDIPDGETIIEDVHKASPFGSMKLYSPLRMFRCNSCRIKFCDNDSLSLHIRSKHRGFLGLLRPQFGCGICSAKFYENKYLVKHCLQHHTSLLEIRSPKKHKITIYRFTQD